MTIRDDRIAKGKEAEQDQVMAELDDAALANCLEKQLVFHASILDLSTKAAIRRLRRGGGLH